MATVRRLLLIAVLLGAIVSGYAFSAGIAASHAVPARQLAGNCPGMPTPC